MKVWPGSTVDTRLTKVEVPLPHSQLVLNKHIRETAPEIQHLLFMPEMDLWFQDHNLNRAPNPVDVYKNSGYDFATDRRIINVRGLGSVGGWVKETNQINFYFLDPKMAVLFKLVWCGQ
jgi:hypothetical protein